MDFQNNAYYIYMHIPCEWYKTLNMSLWNPGIKKMQGENIKD